MIARPVRWVLGVLGALAVAGGYSWFAGGRLGEAVYPRPNFVLLPIDGAHQLREVGVGAQFRQEVRNPSNIAVG